MDLRWHFQTLRVNYNYTTNMTHPNAQRNMVPRAVLMKTSLKSFNSLVRLGKPQQDDTGFIDSGCSRHMSGNIAYLLDFKEFDGGYVTFGRRSTWCQILLKIPRKDNMYSFDIKNIVPKESLTCLVAKATSDESML
ncbi:hypothetical protein Tco_0744532 [Tanacetum coccineum]